MNYTHKLTGEKLTIKKRYGSIVLCRCKPEWIGTMKIDVRVCDIKNLIKEEKQLELFND